MDLHLEVKVYCESYQISPESYEEAIESHTRSLLIIMETLFKSKHMNINLELDPSITVFQKTLGCEEILKTATVGIKNISFFMILCDGKAC